MDQKSQKTKSVENRPNAGHQPLNSKRFTLDKPMYMILHGLQIKNGWFKKGIIAPI